MVVETIFPHHYNLVRIVKCRDSRWESGGKISVQGENKTLTMQRYVYTIQEFQWKIRQQEKKQKRYGDGGGYEERRRCRSCSPVIRNLYACYLYLFGRIYTSFNSFPSFSKSEA